MDPTHRDLLDGWLARVASRPERHCGVFVGDDGESFGHRARPWDYPDVLVSGTVDQGAFVLQFSDGMLHVDEVDSVVPAEHAWGLGLLVSGLINGAATKVWLV